MPPSETGQVPISFTQAEPHWFGVTPPSLLLVLSVTALAVAIVLFATGGWPLGLILLGAGILLVAAFLEVARRKPDGAVTRRSAQTFDSFRARAGSTLELLAARGRSSRESARLRNELAYLQGQRRNLLTVFGDAVYRGDRSADAFRQDLAALDERAATLDRELHQLGAATRDRIEKARLAVQETQMVVPEPYPPPDEGTPPAPAIIPEPSPPPDEATPPTPDPVPNPRPETDPTPPSPER